MPSPRSLQLSQGVLPSGLRLLHYHTDSRVAYLALLIGVGSRDELPTEQGLAHLIEHMLFKGTATRNAFQVSSRLENVGGELNAYTSKEETAIQAAFVPTDLPRALEIVADIACRASFPAQELEREREVVLEEIASYRDSPAELIFDDFEDLLFGPHPLGHSILGVPARVKRFTREDMLRFIAREYAPQRMVLCSCGPYGFTRFSSLAARHFAGLAGPSTLSHRAPFSTTSPQCRVTRLRTAQSHTVVGASAYSMGHPSSSALALLANLLGGYASTALLNRRLRERAGLAYTVECGYTGYSDTGVFTIYFGTDPANLPRAFDLLYRELREICNQPLSSSRLHIAKRQFLGQLYLGSENLESIMLGAGRRLLMGLEPISFQEAEAEVEAITADEMQQVAREVVNPDGLYALIYR